MTTPVILTTDQMATRLGISPRRVRKIAETYGIGSKLTDRMRVFAESDEARLRQHSTGKPGRPPRA